MISHARRSCGALTIAAIMAGCAACAPLPSHHPSPPAPQPHATRPHLAAPAAGVAALLPVSPAQLRAAATLAARFAAAYDTHRPGQPPRAWLARLAPMATRQLTGALTRAATTPADVQAGGSTAGQAVSEQARDLTPTSVIFTVQVRQAATTGRTIRVDAFAVTVTRQRGRWAVYDIEPAAAGDAGEGAADAAAGQ